MVRLAVRVRRDQAEIVLAELLSVAPSGVEEVDVSAGVVEYAVYGAPGELPSLPDLTAAAGGALVEVHTSEVADDWDRRWRSFHRPLVLDGGLVVRPPWEDAIGAPVEIVIDPAQAFGTGSHATTRLCLELMLELASGVPDEPTTRPDARPRLGPFLDLGSGSGVLAIAAARLGWDPVVALDYDPASVLATADNADVNGVQIEVARHDLRVDPVAVAPTVAANLLRPLLLTWAERLARATDLPERVIASGLLAGEADEIAGAFAAVGLVEAARRESGEWAALLLRRTG
ncbi:MAG TPA: 50S ribosomal protein L11 methyltransferase [Solirubrobacteraceae bacterium]|nr:50S ribosomal protein L11 methyltransferase [Solirubrobacteraceae bacterium]